MRPLYRNKAAAPAKVQAALFFALVSEHSFAYILSLLCLLVNLIFFRFKNQHIMRVDF